MEVLPDGSCSATIAGADDCPSTGQGIAMSVLSRRTDQLTRRMFPREAVGHVRARLQIECGTEALGCDGSTPEQMERIHFAVIRLGAADVDALDRAIRLAQTDWRDLLMEADFGHSLTAHDEWYGRTMGEERQ